MKKFISTMLMLICLSMLTWFTGCGYDSGGMLPGAPETDKTYSGKLEKGAFQQGAEIVAYGWDSFTGLTGESFMTLTSDDLGNYKIKSSDINDLLYVKAEGYFYNENTGLLSSSTLKLYGIVDSAKVSWNINVLTHIIKDRVVYLLENGNTYDVSVRQSIMELFSNFNWTDFDPGSQSVSSNAELLLLSAAICKDKTVSEISDILTTLSTDLEDGSVDVSIIDNDFYSLDVSAIETNIISTYGSSPELQSVKDALLTFRNITGPPQKVFTVDAISGYDFFYLTETGNLKGLNSTSKLFEMISISCLITQSGSTDRTVSVNFQSFYTIDGVIYYSALIDGETKYVSQNGSTATIIDQSEMPAKPAKERVTLDHADFQITIDFYDPYVVSDITISNSGGGIIRNVMVNDYFIGYRSTMYGIYYVVVDENEMVRKSGLYFIIYGDTNTISVIVENGELWKL